VRQVLLILRTNAGFHNFIADKQDHRLHERLQSRWRFRRILLIPSGHGEEHKQHQRGVEEQHRHVLGDRKINYGSSRLVNYAAPFLPVALVGNIVVVIVKKIARREYLKTAFRRIHDDRKVQSTVVTIPEVPDVVVLDVVHDHVSDVEFLPVRGGLMLLCKGWNRHQKERQSRREKWLQIVRKGAHLGYFAGF